MNKFIIIMEQQDNNNIKKAQLWLTIEKISEQFESISSKNPDHRYAKQHQALNRLILLRKKCLSAEKNMREKQLALMRERNLYLEKCRQIELYGESEEWGGEENSQENDSKTEEQKLMQEVYEILYTEK